MTEDEIVRWHHRCDRHEFEENLDTERGKNKEAKEHQGLPAVTEAGRGKDTSLE